MKSFIIILFSILALPVFAQSQSIDKEFILSIDEGTKLYGPKIKSPTPNKGVVYISNRLNVNYMDVVEVDIDQSEVAQKKLRFNRPVSTKRKEIDLCESEFGDVQIFSDYIIVSGVENYPARVICFGEGRNYREAYATFLN